jgi:MinD-like ATPase involved in chromosome partitioning or flagellar assembly
LEEAAMDPVTTALVAGAMIVVKTATSEAVKDAYRALKALIADKISILSALEKTPDNKVFHDAAAEEVRIQGLSSERDILEAARSLTQSIEREPPARLVAAGIDVSQIRAATDVILKDLKSTGSIKISEIEARTGKVDIQGIAAGDVAKN